METDEKTKKIFAAREKVSLEDQEGTYEHYQKFMQSDEVKEHRRQLLREMSEGLLGVKNG